MPTKSLPASFNLELERKLAKGLLKELRAGNAQAVARFREFHPRFAKGGEIPKASLADAQLVIAREYGFASWAKLKAHVEEKAIAPEVIERFKEAVIAGDARQLDALLDQHPELEGVIDRPMFEGDEPAIVHARFKCEIVDVLLEHGADINAHGQFWGRSLGVLDEVPKELAEYYISRGAVGEIGAFAEAVKYGNVEEVERLLAASAKLREQIDRPCLPFGGRATRFGAKNRRLMDVLLKYGADINLKSDWWAGGFGVFDECAPEMVEYLIERGAIVDVFAAAKWNKFDRLKQLIEADPALVQAKGGDGKRPLHYASTKEIIDYLLSKGAEVDARCVDHNSTAAQYAVKEMPWKTRYLLERGAELDIFMAAALGDIELLKQVLDRHPEAIKARVARPGYAPVPPMHTYEWVIGGGLSVLQVARKFGHNDAADRLVERSGPKLKFLDACSMGNEKAARDVLAHEPALMSKLEHEDYLLLNESAQWNRYEAVKLMLDLGFPVDEPNDNDRFTPLHLAAIRGYVPLVKLLLERGADPNRQQCYGGNGLGSCLWGSLNLRDSKGDYPATTRVLLEGGVKVPGKAWGSSECQDVIEEFKSRK